MTSQAIGYIDSGIGGITVAREALRQLPHEVVYYVGDTARMPYGPRPKEEVLKYTWEMVDFLVKKDIKMLVIACNTATAAALPDLRAKLDIPVIGVIAPGVRGALRATNNKKIGVIATAGTVKSEAYAKALEHKDNAVRVSQLACPEFVQIVEANQSDSPAAATLIADKLAYFADKDIDTLVLGCTHFPLLDQTIGKVMGEKVTLVNSGAVAIENVSAMLDELNISNSDPINRAKDEYYTTGDVTAFHTLASRWLNNDDLNVQHLAMTSTGLKLED
ncbi:glutamate racemase [Periweissella ghanensis]|uniref:Glutamate racemase n=1 Tax=Periweissella ghanensis TaxID=467997 RepID=A0ABM8ZCL7_9LACO|nr:glutamate racemase [Periweissella ghanensis]MCM0600101.1 glutamate racemase [Periweissella ghanensis]CAH0419032.1 Glutamate racemase [Periweissella ghanensis]